MEQEEDPRFWGSREEEWKEIERERERVERKMMKFEFSKS